MLEPHEENAAKDAKKFASDVKSNAKLSPARHAFQGSERELKIRVNATSTIAVTITSHLTCLQDG